MSKYLTISEIRVLANETLDKLGQPDLKAKLKIEFNYRYVARMGTAFLLYNKVVFSGKLFPRATEQQRYETVIHEVCHIVAFIQYKDNGHGRAWKHLMNVCGVKAERCLDSRSIDRTGLVRQHQVACGCNKGPLVGPQVFKKILCGKKYRCNICRQTISAKGKDMTVEKVAFASIPEGGSFIYDDIPFTKELIEDKGVNAVTTRTDEGWFFEPTDIVSILNREVAHA